MAAFESMRSLLCALLAMVIVLRHHGAVLPELGGFASLHLQDLEDTWEVLALPLAHGSAEVAAFWGIFHESRRSRKGALPWLLLARHATCVALLYVNLARSGSLSQATVQRSWWYAMALSRRWGPVASWGITAPPTLEDWQQWLDEVDQLAPNPELLTSEAVTGAPLDIFHADLDLSELGVEDQTPPPSPAASSVSVATCVSQEPDASSAVAADLAIPARLEEVSAAEDLFQTPRRHPRKRDWDSPSGSELQCFRRHAALAAVPRS
ncbi:PGC [Symbiodinium sp. CCMP2592]|nr:PGC [Symbiodinium sp. CCMP2592]CAE7232230.1 PGC [Symbiodinium sp. CCMP2592]